MKGTLIGLSKAWNKFKMPMLQQARDVVRKNVQLSIKRINQYLETRYNKTVKVLTNHCQTLPTDEPPNTGTINLFGAPGYPQTRSRLLGAPKLSLDERVLIMRQREAERKEKLAKYRNKMLNGSNIQKRRRVSPRLVSHVSIESGVEEVVRSQKRASSPASEVLAILSEIADGNYLRMTEAEERRRQEDIREEEERRLSARKAYEDRYKLIPPEQELSGASKEGLRRLSSKEEGERRRKNLRANMSRTEKGKMIAYGCGERFDWEKEWEKKKTPAVCGKKRKRLYTFDSYLEERKPVRRRTGLTSSVFVHEPRSTAFPVFYFNPYGDM